MKKLLFVIFLVQVFNVAAQETFNKRMRYGFPAAVMTSVVPTDSFYYATSIIADSVPPYRTGNAFLKFGLDGGLLDIKTLTDTEKTYEAWFDNFVQLPGGGFAVQGYSFDSTTSSILIRYGTDGDTVFVRSYFNPFSPAFEFIQPRGGLVACQDGGFLLANAVRTSSSNLENYLIKTDSLGNTEWDRVYLNGDWDRPQSLLAAPDGGYIVGAIQTNDNVAVSDFIYRCHIFKVDSLGNPEWDYLTPEGLGLRDAANDMVLLDDGSLVVASGIGHEQERSSVNVVYFEKTVFRLSPDRELEWEIKFPDEDTTSWSRTTKIIKLSDGSGFLLGGMAYEELPAPMNFTVRGWLAKISNEGGVIWTRQHVYLDDGEDEHGIFDLKETPDGGFIACGEARDWESGTTYPQQAWLLKLDEHGCLVPGCNLVDDVDEAAMHRIEIAIYPNPASDYLNFQLRGSGISKSGEFRIVDGEGRFVKLFPARVHAGNTFTVPVWDWAAGVYFLQYLDGERNVIIWDRFIVSH